jgi:short-subunit dehydrogenase involved in D-alanine esterification of teichoic acids
MPTQGTMLIVGGTLGIGFEAARYFADQGNEVVVSGRDRHRADSAARGDRWQDARHRIRTSPVLRRSQPACRALS